MRRWGAALLALCAAASLSGCATLPKKTARPDEPSSASPPVSSAPAKEEIFSLSYSSEDTLNPYAAKSRVNLDLASLLYEGLTVLDDAFMPQMSVAASVTQTDPTHWTALLRSDAVYADGSKVTAADVAASFALAKASANYKESVSNIQSAAASEESVVFTLASPDPHTAACLTFPILKSGTVTNEPARAPVGGGRYVYTPGEPAVLKANPKCGKTMSIPTIRLQHLPNLDAMAHALDNGTIRFFFSDLSDGEVPRSSGAGLQVSLPYLVFLGVNRGRSALSAAPVRQALSKALDRTALCETAYSGRAEAAGTPFHPLWKPAVEIRGFSTGENLSEAVAQLGAAGYNTKSEGGAEKRLSLELLYSTGNSFRTAAAEQIKQQLETAGVSVNLTPLAFSEYEARLRGGKFDLYLGEIRLTGNMSLRALLTSGGAAAFGGMASGAAADAYRAYLAGEVTAEQFTGTFVEDVPYIPLCWRKGAAAYSRNMTQVTPTAFDVYYGLEHWRTDGAS